MRELIRSNDPVRLSWLQAVLTDAGIPCVVLDGHTSILEGSLGVLPRRLMVEDTAYDDARRAIAAAEPDADAEPDDGAEPRDDADGGG